MRQDAAAQQIATANAALASLGIDLSALLQAAQVVVPGASSSAAKSDRPCAHWAEFRCEYGDLCKFSHDGPGGASERGLHPSVANQLHQPEDVVAQAQALLAAQQQWQQPLQPTAAGAVASICAHWAAFKCEYGTGCRFAHEGPGACSSRGPLQPPPPTTPHPFLAAHGGSLAPKKDRLCNHWQAFKCNYGDACQFSHAGPGGPCIPAAAAGGKPVPPRVAPY